MLDNRSIIFGVFYRPPNTPDSCSSNLFVHLTWKHQFSLFQFFQLWFYVGTSTSVTNIDWNSIIPTFSDKAAVHLCYIIHNFQQYILEPTSGTTTSTIF